MQVISFNLANALDAIGIRGESAQMILLDKEMAEYTSEILSKAFLLFVNGILLGENPEIRKRLKQGENIDNDELEEKYQKICLETFPKIFETVDKETEDKYKREAVLRQTIEEILEKKD